MIIAHPDDEIIFGGFDLLIEKSIKVICVTNGNNPIRSKEFRIVMEKLKINYEILNNQDSIRGFPTKFELSKYENIITHNSEGEYGHRQHIQLHRLLRQNTVRTFKCGNQLSEDIIRQKYELLSIYKSQKHIIHSDRIKFFIERCISV